ncbi:lysine--tRNA ligase [Bdellovibrio bacteriovorus]|uniref:Lysine--tRNA ligase n=1 Tax=Bdellovibrio bacteriovorus TaxID=959 RepID=A0A1Z3N7I0_BDEBC|nr:lysine--tRNA ligase [Bdellovibrio bacteriovorus]ASD63430.1 lysine--tRNA ligase [Bdellovibrio bacteriovorus]
MSINENPLRAEKRKKLHALREKGINPYPYVFENKAKISEVTAEHAATLQAGEKKPEFSYRIAGRLMTLRMMGKASFFNLQDQTGSVQVYVKTEELSEQDRAAFELVDLGDIVGIEGFVFKSQKGEFSIYAKSFQILTKTIEPLPEKFHGVQDIEIKYRHRHLDLMTDADSRKVFETRSKIIKEVRRFLDDRGFMEVETPTLQPVYGGAAATPFTTHHKALDMKLYMRISPELYLKRLIVGGFEKVYEISKNFRNEGIDRTHNPEFALLEFYEAYTDYNYQMKQFEELISSLALKITGSMKVTYQGKEIDFTPPWRRLTVHDGVKEYAGIDPDKATDQEIFQAIRKNGGDIDEPGKRGEMIMELFELTAEQHLWQPTFVMDHPVEISPLTKIHRRDNRLVERFEPFAACMEIGNAYSELNDPEDQLARLKEQEANRAKDEEAHPMDEDFLLAIDAGMPPTGGVGIGIERIVMLLTDRPSIRDIIFFPTMRITK